MLWPEFLKISTAQPNIAIYTSAYWILNNKIKLQNYRTYKASYTLAGKKYLYIGSSFVSVSRNLKEFTGQHFWSNK